MKKIIVGLLIAACCAVAAPVTTMAAEANIVGDQAALTVNVNDATSEELQQLPGVGKAISQRIIEYREQVGPFQQPDDLMKVKGIGRKTMDHIRSMIAVE